MSRLPVVASVTAVLLTSLALPAAAQVDVYGTEAAYDAAVGAPLFSLDFFPSPSGGALVDGSSFSPAVTFSSPESVDPTKIWWNSNAITDTGSTVALNGVGPLAGSFTAPVRAFAMHVISGTLVGVHLFDAANAPIGFAAAPGGAFIGITSTVPVKSFLLEHLFFSPGNRDRLFIDDLKANEAALSLEELHEILCELIDGLDPATDMTHPSVAVNANRKNALQNRCEALGHAIAAGDWEDALDQLQSMRDKADGAGDNDWIQGAAAAAFVNAVDTLVDLILAILP